MNEFYKRLIKDELYKYIILKDRLGDMIEEVEELEEKKSSKIVASYGTAPVNGGGSSFEEKLININAKIEMLKENIKNAESLIKKYDRALSVLNDKEEDILIRLCSNKNRRTGEIYKLERKYSYSKSEIYRLCDLALEKLALCLYGTC